MPYHQSHSEFIICGITFQCSAPYREGHTCNEVEARILNQVRKENVRNNFSHHVDKDRVGDKDYVAGLYAKLADYDQEYSFHGPKKLDPIVAEAKAIAKGLVLEALQKKGVDITLIDPEKLEKKVSEAAKMEDILVEAARRVQSARAIATQSFDILS